MTMGGKNLSGRSLTADMDTATHELQLWRLAGRAFALIMLAVGAALAWPSVAEADYSVIECVPNIVGAPDAVSTVHGSPKIAQTNECTGGGRPGWGLGLESNGASSRNEWKGWFFQAPPYTRFVTAKASIHEKANYGYGGIYQGDAPANYFPQGDVWNQFVIDNTTSYQVFLMCFASGGCSSPGSAGDLNLDAGYAFVTNFTAQVQDQVAPTITAAGDVFQGEVVRGTQSVNVGISDLGGGAASIRVSVNGIPSTATGPLCPPNYVGGYYTALKPCSNNSSGTLLLDTEHGPGWSNGPNDVVVCGYDIAGNQSNCIRRAVQVDNSCPGSGGTAAATLDAGADVNGTLKTRAAVTSSQEPVIRGSLKDGAGDAVPGATVCIYETVDLPDASHELATSVTTQGNGRFATKLGAGASRSVDAVYRHNERVLADKVELASTVVPTLQVPTKKLANGQSALFLGRLPGPNADGRAVALQARVGRKWRTFKQLRTDATGAFKGRYRFTVTFGRQRYLFRALVKRQSGYPYEPGASRRRKVIVHG
jgi:hypothetical protein